MEPRLVDELEDEHVEEDLRGVLQLPHQDAAQLGKQRREDQVVKQFNHAHRPPLLLPMPLPLDCARRLIVVHLMPQLVRAEQRLRRIVGKQARVRARRERRLRQQRRDVVDGRDGPPGRGLLQEGFGRSGAHRRPGAGARALLLQIRLERQAGEVAGVHCCACCLCLDVWEWVDEFNRVLKIV